MLALSTPARAFPPAGKLVNVAAFRPLNETRVADLGGFQLEHCYEDLLAYLMNMLTATTARDAYNKHCEAILVQLNVRASIEAKAAEAYRFKEAEEDDRDELGHSVCTRGKLPTGVVEDHMYAVPSKLLEHGDEKLAELDTDHCDGTAELKSKS